MKKLLVILMATYLLSTSVFAGHAWSSYHWARTTASFDLILINSTTDDWHDYVGQAVIDWSVSTKVNLAKEGDGTTNKKIRRQCKAPAGKVRICNLAYGQTGWLGIAGISLDAEGHITRGYTKLNDTYFSWSYYNNADWKQSVTCQELGHNLGLGHQDEDFDQASSISCMEYQDPPFLGPDSHDFEQLGTIYDDVDSYNSYSGGASTGGNSTDGNSCNAPKGKGCNKSEKPSNNSEIGWGMSLGRRGNKEVFIRIDRHGIRHLTYVTWAKEH